MKLIGGMKVILDIVTGHTAFARAEFDWASRRVSDAKPTGSSPIARSRALRCIYLRTPGNTDFAVDRPKVEA